MPKATICAGRVRNPPFFRLADCRSKHGCFIDEDAPGYFLVKSNFIGRQAAVLSSTQTGEAALWNTGARPASGVAASTSLQLSCVAAETSPPSVQAGSISRIQARAGPGSRMIGQVSVCLMYTWLAQMGLVSIMTLGVTRRRRKIAFLCRGGVRWTPDPGTLLF
ncbi:uncharacterized protein K452DRAFT_145133 [Aplosporella prunicola CBS 121167]|uniref:Uncharacterized protein n=1 Tax=Aplosporella prunicola CBS 121167 TaxID=1176127 RepID=A0A6A6BP75_9PEZI|nr:uncharacterized protein K452DRAFT_145133 [Aplosporella prunicola CBS 121167]KAF2144657.1 hypothetical protein K452DRAFT_145133 [Aplosporella prunicola CBS 121167]